MYYSFLPTSGFFGGSIFYLLRITLASETFFDQSLIFQPELCVSINIYTFAVENHEKRQTKFRLIQTCFDIFGSNSRRCPDCFKFWAKIWCERKPIKSLSTHAQNIWIVTLDKILMSWCEWHFLSDFFLQELKFQNTHPSDTTVIRTYFAMGNNLFLLQICRQHLYMGQYGTILHVGKSARPDDACIIDKGLPVFIWLMERV